MGTSSSSLQLQEGDHFAQVINPKSKSNADPTKPKSLLNGIKLNPKAAILKKMSYSILWDKFLSGTAASFALTQSEASAVMLEAALSTGSADGNIKFDEKTIEREVKLFIDHVADLSEKDTSKSVDFMAVCSSVLLISDVSIEVKVDQLYEWIVLKESPASYDTNFDEFLVALSSFERGLSHAMGFHACSETFVRTVASQWIALADPKHKGSADSQTKISNKNFFEFCTNRQHIVRKLLETFANSVVVDVTRSTLNEVVDTVNELKAPTSGGDEWMANPAWKKTAERMVPPSVKSSTSADTKPTSTLTLEWVHGYRGFDCRNNVHYLATGGEEAVVLYSAAAVGIALDAGTSRGAVSQTHFTEHGDDIISLALHSGDDGNNLIASGEIGKTPAIYLYSFEKAAAGRGGANSFQSLTCMKGFHTKGVAQLAFNATGSLLFSVGVDYTVAIYNTDRGAKLFGKMEASSQGPKDKVLHCSALGSSFVSCGEKHVSLWRYESKTLKQEVGKLGTFKNKFVMSVAALSADTALLSTSEGELLSMSGLSVLPVLFSPALQAGEGHGKNAVNALHCAGQVVLSGGKDGKVIVWKVVSTGATVTLRLVLQFSIHGHSTDTLVARIVVSGVDNTGPNGTSNSNSASAKKPVTASAVGGAKPSAPPGPALPAIRSLCISRNFRKILVGTSTCEVLEFALPHAHPPLHLTTDSSSSPPVFSVTPLVCGHFKDEVWGLAVRPVTAANRSENCEYCTVGDDGYLRFWDLQEHKQLRCLALGGMARSVAYSPDASYIAVGFGGRTGAKNGKNKEDGMVRVYRFDVAPATGGHAMTLCVELKEAKQWISSLKFSPDGSVLAVGSRDNSIYLYSVNQQFKRKAKFSKHNAGLNQFDFTADGKYLQSCCSGYEILFSDANTGVQLTDGATKLQSAEWDSWTCTLGWPVIGIWSGAMDGSDVNSVARSPSGQLLATSDDFGKVNVFKFPAIREGGNAHAVYNGHSSHVTGVCWVSLSGTAVDNGKLGRKTDDYLISIGGEDKCVFQWRNSGCEEPLSKHLQSVSLDDVEVQLQESDSSSSFFDAPGGGDEFTAVKPWLGAIVAPTAWTSADTSKIHPFYAALGEFSTQHKKFADEVVPAVRTGSDVSELYADISRAADTVLQKLYESGVDNRTAVPDLDELELEWVHGYRGFDCRNNVFYVEPRGAQASRNSNSDSTVQRNVVYYAAALGIVLDPVTRTQRYFKGHSDDIMSMAVHKPPAAHDVDAVVATGQQGLGCIQVWEVPSLRTLATIDTRQKSVHMLLFSGDGRLLVSVAEDKTVAVSDWRSGTVLCNTKGEAAVTHHLATTSATGAQFNFVTCGDKHIRYWTLNGRNLTANKVSTTGCGAKVQQFLSVTELRGNYYVGCEDGSICVVPGEGKAVKFRFDHSSSSSTDKKNGAKAGPSITALYSSSERGLLISGAKDGTVVVWDADHIIVDVVKARMATFSVDELGAVGINAKQIQSISLLMSANPSDRDLVLIIATRGCDILEVHVGSDGAVALYGGVKSPARDRVLVRGHCNDELWGVACHPTKPEYCSVGDDKTLRFFDLHSRMMTALVPLGNIARTICYNKDGSLLAVGFGGRVGKGKETGGGLVRLYSVERDENAVTGATKVSEKQDAKQWISDVKFSPDDSTLAVGAHDCKIYIYSVTKSDPNAKAAPGDGPASPFTLKLRSVFNKHNSVINHIDLSSDGRYMQSNCSAYELLFCDTTTGKQITSAKELRDVKWHSWTCTLGWPVQGIWSAGMDGSDINAVARSHSGHLLATSDDFGKVNIYKYPCVAVGALPLKYSGHSSHVMNVRWTAGDECLVSCGGNDKCLMQWRHSIADVSSSAGMGGSRSEKSGRAPRSRATTVSFEDEEDKSEESGGATLFEGGPGGGDECGAVKPWLGAIRAPKNPPPISALAPASELNLTWVHGYTSGTAGANNSRISNNLFYNLEHNPVYPAAALAIQLNRSDVAAGGVAAQNYFRGHDDDVLSLAISKDRRFIATGQTASKTSKGKGSVIVWDAVQARSLCRMDGCHSRGVVSLAFSPDGSMLLSVGLDDNNTHTLWSDMGGGWSRVQQIASEKSDKNPVLFSRWVHPSNPMASTSEYHFLSGGGSGVNFWKQAGSTLSKKQGRFGRKYKQCPLLCAANLQGKDSWQMVVGTSTGDLYSYAEREVTNSVEKAHSGPVLCLSEGGPDCLFLVSGGRDKCVKVWNSQLQPISSFDCTQFACCDGSVASIDIHPSSVHLTLLVGTYGGEILELSSKADEEKPAKSSSSHDSGTDTRNLDLSNAAVEVLVHSHFSGELWGVATHPLQSDIVATVGDDSTLRVWSIKQHKMIRCHKLGWPARCVAWHPLGNLLAVGFHELVKGGHNKAGNSAIGGKKGKSKNKAAAAATPASGDSNSQPQTGTEAEDLATNGTHEGSVHLFSFKHAALTNAVEIKKIASGCDSIAWIADIKFSHDGLTLAASSHDKKLYAFKLPQIVSGDSDFSEWSGVLNKAKFVFNKHSSAVLHFDFSLDSKFFQTNCQAGELLFGAVEDGAHEKSASKLADYNSAVDDDPDHEGRMWGTQTCILGWPVQGIWPSANNIQLSDIDAVDRHVSNKVLATADDFGLIKLFRYPVVKEGSKFGTYTGHSSHVTNVRWNIENHLISTGGNDKCVFIWHMTEK